MGRNYGLFREVKMPESTSRLPRSARDWGEGNLRSGGPSPPLRGCVEPLFLFPKVKTLGQNSIPLGTLSELITLSRVLRF